MLSHHGFVGWFFFFKYNQMFLSILGTCMCLLYPVIVKLDPCAILINND